MAYTAATNGRSQRLMTRLGMERDPSEDFLHPRIPADDPLAPHVLYRLAAAGGPANELDSCAAATPTLQDRKS